MPWIDVDAVALEKGTLPPVCLVTGSREGVGQHRVQLGSPTITVLTLALLFCGPPLAALLAWFGSRSVVVPLTDDAREAHERGVILYRASLVASGVLWGGVLLRGVVEAGGAPGFLNVAGIATPLLTSIGAGLSLFLPFGVYLACVRRKVVMNDGLRLAGGPALRLFVPSPEAARALGGQ